MRLNSLMIRGLAGLALAACPSRQNVQCEKDTNCDLSGGGVCVAASTGNQWCAYPDPECPSGFRYSRDDIGDDVGGMCTGDIGNRAKLTVMVGGNGSGRVTSTPAGIDCPGTCAATFLKGDVVTLAQAPQSSVFLGWSDSCTGATSCSVAIDANKQVGALFGIPGSNVWLSQLGASTDAVVTLAKALSTRDVVIGGRFAGTIVLGTTTLTSQGAPGKYDGFVARLRAADGTVAWSKQFAGKTSLTVMGLDVDVADNIIVTGQFAGAAVFNGMSVNSSGGDLDVFVAKLSGVDGAYVWARTFGDASPEYPIGVAVDTSGNAIIAGSFYGTISPGPTPLSAMGKRSMFLVKYAGTNGAHLWSKAITGDHAISANVAKVVVDGTGNVVVAGYFYGATDFGGGVVTSMNTNTGTQFVAKYAAANGAHLLDKEFSLSGSNYASIRALAADSAGSIYVAGEFDNTLNFGAAPLISAGAGDVYVAKYSVAGAPLWSRSFGNTLQDLADAIAIDAAGQLLFVGRFQGTISYGATNFTAAGGYDIAVARLNTVDGSILKSMRLGGTREEISTAVTGVGSNVFVGGGFAGFSEFGGQAITASGVADGFSLLVMPLN
jgi:hypothetical protein